MYYNQILFYLVNYESLFFFVEFAEHREMAFVQLLRTQGFHHFAGYAWGLGAVVLLALTWV